MTFWKYLKDQLFATLFWLGLLIITLGVLVLTPSVRFDKNAFLYIILLQTLFFISYLIAKFIRKTSWWEYISDIEDKRRANDEYFLEEEQFINRQLLGYLDEEMLIRNRMMKAQQENQNYIDGWTHEIKVPLSATKLLIESSEDVLSDSVYAQLENELKKIDDYIEQALYYTRTDSFSRDYFIQEYELSEIVQAIIKSYANYFIQKKIKVQITGEAQQILTDKKWLVFILNQIFSNALKYTPDGGSINVELLQSEKGVTLAISDTGIGIPLEDQKRVFEKGFTGENGRRTAQNATGLGLYLANILAGKLGHVLSLESKVGVGTTFYVYFPFLTFYNERPEERFKT
ncbi:MAG: sensor histidine kinase [Streptococcaceae bacterium]|jgi:signal transduction histidine kinase|nr:sensor histidine kinase [Streptococcaceae bacterium]